MKDNLKKIIDIVEVLCDAVSDGPCGCDACPYVDTITNDEDCEAISIKAKLEQELKKMESEEGD